MRRTSRPSWPTKQTKAFSHYFSKVSWQHSFGAWNFGMQVQECQARMSSWMPTIFSPPRIWLSSNSTWSGPQARKSWRKQLSLCIGCLIRATCMKHISCRVVTLERWREWICACTFPLVFCILLRLRVTAINWNGMFMRKVKNEWWARATGRQRDSCSFPYCTVGMLSWENRLADKMGHAAVTLDLWQKAASFPTSLACCLSDLHSLDLLW